MAFAALADPHRRYAVELLGGHFCARADSLRKIHPEFEEKGTRSLALANIVTFRPPPRQVGFQSESLALSLQGDAVEGG